MTVEEKESKNNDVTGQHHERLEFSTIRLHLNTKIANSEYGESLRLL